MAKQLYNEFADISALEEQKKKILGIFSDVKAGIISLAEVGVKIDSSKNINQLGAAEKQYSAYIKQTENLVKQLADSEAKLVVIRQKESLQLTENKQKLKQLNQEQAERVKLQNSEKGSIAQLEAQYAKAYRIFKQLGEAQRDSTRGQTLNKYLEDTSNRLNELKKSAGNFSANVGRYAGSLAAPFETLAKKLEELKANLKNGIGVGGNDEAALQRAAQSITIIEAAIEKSSGASTTTVKQVKNLSNAFTDLSITMGKTEGTTFLSSLGVQIGEAKDSAQDLKDELKLNASDTKGIDNVVGSLNALAGIAQGAAGAYALMGASEEDAAKVTSKLIAIQGIANSIQQVGTELTKRGTIANKAYEFAQRSLSVAMDGTAKAGARLKGALITLGIGAVIIGIGLLIANYDKIKQALSGVSKQQQVLNDLNEKAIDGYIKEKTEIGLLVDEYQDLGTNQKRKAEIQKKLQDDYPAYFGNLKTEKEFAEGLTTAYGKLARALFLKARVQAATSLISENEGKALKLELEANQVTDKRFGDKFFGGLTGKRSPETIKRLKDELFSEAATIRKDNEFLIKTILDSQKEIDALGGDPNKKGDKVETKKTEAKKITDATPLDVLRSQAELAKQKIQLESDTARKIFEDETSSFQDRLDSLKAFTAAQMTLIKVEQDFEIASEKIRLQEIIAGLEEQKKEKGANIKALSDQEAKEREASDLRIQVIEGAGFAKRIKAVEDFNTDLKALKDARQTIRDEERKQIEDYEAWTLDQINKAREAMRQGNAAWDAKDLEDKKKAAENIRAATIKASEELQATILFFLTSNIDAELASLDTKKRLLDEYTQHRINQVNQLGLTEQERIKQTAIIEKQSMYETEQIERRKRKLAVERARFEKLANIASIISSTAQAVVAALGMKPWSPANIALAFAVGGLGVLQLARAVAAPLPQYYTGTDSAAPGLAWTGERGSELMKRDGKYYLTPNHATLMNMQGGEQITPAHVTEDILNSINFTRSTKNGMTLLHQSGMSSEQADTLIDEIKDLKKETSKNRIVLNIGSGVDWEAYVYKNIR